MGLLWIKSLVKAIALPPTGPLLLALVGVAIAGRHPRRGRWLAFTGIVLLVLLAMPAVGTVLTRCLNATPPLDLSAAQGAQAIVILGGGTRDDAPEYGGTTMNATTLERVRYGARVARATGLPVLVSGGAMNGAPPEAVLMRDALVHEFGVPVRWLETRSRDTHENAVMSAAMLEASGVRHVILVGHSFDFPRSRNEFESARIAVTPAPIGIPSLDVTFEDFLPGINGLQSSYRATYEILANALYYVTN